MGLVSRGRNRPSGNARNHQETTKPPASGGAYRAGEAPVAWRRRWGLALRKWFPARYGEPGREALWLLRLAEQFGQLGLDVDEVGLVAGRHDRVGALEEVGDLLDRRLEVGLAEGGGQLDVQHGAGLAAHGPGRRPHDHVPEALAALDAAGQQLSREDPLDRLIEPNVERDADRVRVFLRVVKARHERDDRLLRDDQPKSEFCRYRAAAVHRQSNLKSAVGPG